MDHHPKPECGQAASVIRLWGYGPARVTAQFRLNGSWRYITLLNMHFRNSCYKRQID